MLVLELVNFVHYHNLKKNRQLPSFILTNYYFEIYPAVIGSHCFQVNLTILQVSIVEEVISFSALDNIKDLTCVSLFSVCLENVNVKFHSDEQVRAFP